MRVQFRPDKIALLLTLVLALNFGLYGLSRKFYLEDFARLEREVLHDNLTRAFNAVYHDVDNLQLLATDWAEWDDSYRFMVDRAPEFLASNMPDGTLETLQLNLLLFLDQDGEVVWQAQADDNLNPRPVDAGLVRLLNENVKTLNDEGEGAAGLLHFGSKLWMVALQPILDSKGAGPSRGTLIMGRNFNPRTLGSLSNRIQLDLQLEFWDADQVERSLNRTPSRLGGGAGRDLHFVADQAGAATIDGHALLFDLSGKFGPVLTMKMQRRIYLEGEHTAYSFLAWTLVFSLLSAGLIYLIMDRLAQTAGLRRENEVRYKRLSSEFKTILDGIPSSISLIDPQLRVVWANRASGATGPSRFSQPDAESLSLHQCSFSPERCTVCCALRTGEACQDLELEEGGRTLNVSAFPLATLAGEHLRGVIRIATDVTEEYRLRAEHEQASRLAAVGELAAGVAHEINNPNGMIQMNLGLVADVWNDLQPLLDEAEDADPDLQLGGLGILRLRQEFPELLQDMHHASSRIKGIVEDLKGFVRRQDDTESVALDLNEVYQTAVRLLSNQIKKSGADFREILTADLPQVRGQFRQLEQVVINLVMNACQALEKPGALLEVRTWHDLAAGEVVLVVEDRGKGIAPAALTRITDPFFTTRRNQGGTGLGLSVSARIVKEHGGRLLFSSEVGKGTSAELRLPVVVSEG